MFVLCVVSKEKQANCRTVKTKKPERLDYKRIQKKKNRRGHGGLLWVLCLMSGRGLWRARSLVQRNPTDCGVCIWKWLGKPHLEET
jgi:hypothetical protein